MKAVSSKIFSVSLATILCCSLVALPSLAQAPEGPQGGQPQHLSKGDVVVVPAGIPHWFKEVPQSISYYVVKVLKP